VAEFWFLVFLALIAVALTAALTDAMRRFALARSLVDVPNARSSHQVATPRGGGVALVGVFVLGSLVLAARLGLPTMALVAVLGGGALVAAIGYWDDYGHVGAGVRLLVQFAAALLALALLGGLPALVFGSWTVEWGLLGYLLGAIGIAWLINLYNFMDGIDGIAGIELVTVALGAALLLSWRGAMSAAVWLVLLAACGLGFLVHNWPPARIFMGDAGSGFLGFVLAVFALWTGDVIGLWSWGILLGVFLVDATWTLLRRLLARQRVYEAHRSHAYQHAARCLGAHWPVTLVVGLINVLWLLPLAALAAWQPAWGWWLLLLAWAPLGYLAWWFEAGVAT